MPRCHPNYSSSSDTIPEVDLLLDTHAFIWWDSRDPRLDEVARTAIANAENRIIVSAASIWEIAIKRMIGKLAFRHGALEALERNGFEALDIGPRHADLAGSLPLHHTDPFDRMLIAQAKLEGLVLLSLDRQLLPYGVPILGAI
jgi:PIN domain nuclease of toxin-antitoxin system